MDYNQVKIDAEFSALEVQAQDCVELTGQGMTNPRVADQHDECAAKYSVYHVLHDRPFICSRASMLSELYWLRDAKIPAPDHVHSPDRFTSARFSLVRSLIVRFERPADYAMRYGAQLAH